MDTLHLKALGYPHQEIGQMVGISQKTLRDYVRRYQAGGIEALKARNFYQPQSALEPYRAILEAEFKARPAQSMKEAADRIEKLTQVGRSPDQVRRYLTKLGLKRLKTGQVPAKADPKGQADFLKKTRTPARRSSTRKASALLC
jgi:transposase